MFVSDLDIILRAGNIDHLVLAGITTSGVVLTTLRQAADLEFAFAVLADGCLDSDPEVHRYWWKRCSPPDGRHHRR
jgi:nicotinamidase-related amidase